MWPVVMKCQAVFLFRQLFHTLIHLSILNVNFNVTLKPLCSGNTCIMPITKYWLSLNSELYKSLNKSTLLNFQLSALSRTFKFQPRGIRLTVISCILFCKASILLVSVVLSVPISVRISSSLFVCAETFAIVSLVLTSSWCRRVRTSSTPATAAKACLWVELIELSKPLIWNKREEGLVLALGIRIAALELQIGCWDLGLSHTMSPKIMSELW